MAIDVVEVQVAGPQGAPGPPASWDAVTDKPALVRDGTVPSHPALTTVWDRCWRDSAGPATVTDSGHSWTAVPGEGQAPTIAYADSKGPLTIVCTGSNSVAQGGFLVDGFNPIMPSISVVFRSTTSNWFRHLIVKWIDENNWLGLRMTDRSIRAVAVIDGVETETFMLSGAAGGWPQTAVHIHPVTRIDASIAHVHTNYTASNRALVVNVNGGHWVGAYPVPVGLTAAGRIGWLTSARDFLYHFSAFERSIT